MELYYDKTTRPDFKADKETQDKCEHDWNEDGDYHGATVHRCEKCGKVEFGGF